MSVSRKFDPRKTFKVSKNFVEAGRKWAVGEIYKPRFGSSKRIFRHWIAKKLEMVIDGDSSYVAKEIPEPVEVEVQKEVEGDVVKVIVDDGDDFQVEYKGVTFPVNRNQVRKDGSLTAGGFKAFEKASA